VVVADSLDDTVKEFCSKLQTFVTYSDPDVAIFGLENAILPIGHSFVEVVAPIKANSQDTAAGRYINRFGCGGYMILVQLRDGEAMQNCLLTCSKNHWEPIHTGSRDENLISKPFSLDGPGFEGNGIAGIHLHPKVTGCIAELSIQKPRSKWEWAGRKWFTADERTKIAHSSSIGFAAVVIAATNHQLIVDNWQKALDLPQDRIIKHDHQSTLTLDDDTELIFRNPSHPQENGLVELHVYTTKAKDVTRTSIGGLDVVLKHPFGKAAL